MLTPRKGLDLALDPTSWFQADWRAARAFRLATNPQPASLRPTDDQYIRSYVRLLRDHLDEVDNLEALSRNSHDVNLRHAWLAHLLHIDRNRAHAYLVKAWLLAGYTDEEIAVKSGARPQAIETYAALHFDVRHGLGGTGWIDSVALNPARIRATSPGARSIDQQGYVWMAVGYHGKKFGLEWLLDEAAEKPTSMTPTNWLNERREREIAIAALKGSLLYDPNSGDFKRLVTAARALQEAVSQTDTTANIDQVGQILQAVQRGLPKPSMNQRENQPTVGADPCRSDRLESAAEQDDAESDTM